MSETKDMSETNEPVEVCPNCGSYDVVDCHAEASYSLPETNYKACCDCNHQWGHE